MDELFLEAIRKLVYYKRSIDNLGFCNFIPAHLIDDLELQFKKYCRKHGIKARK